MNNMEPIKKRKGYPSNAQKARLIQIMQADEELRCGKFSASFTKKVAEARWAAISSEINSIPGAKKTWMEWRRTWQDMKAKTKKKETALRRCLNGTGGGPPPESLSGDEILILSTLSETELQGHADSSESAVCFKDLPSCSQSLSLGTLNSSSKNTSDDIDLPSCSQSLHIETLNASKNSCDNTDLPNSQITLPNVPITSSKSNDECEAHQDVSNKENMAKKKTTLKRTVARKRLDQSIETANNLKEALIEKNRYKKIFYEGYLKEMRRQTDALLLIANNLKKD